MQITTVAGAVGAELAADDMRAGRPALESTGEQISIGVIGLLEGLFGSGFLAQRGESPSRR